MWQLLFHSDSDIRLHAIDILSLLLYKLYKLYTYIILKHHIICGLLVTRPVIPGPHRPHPAPLRFETSGRNGEGLSVGGPSVAKGANSGKPNQNHKQQVSESCLVCLIRCQMIR